MFKVESIEPVVLIGPREVTAACQMSPYVWPAPDGPRHHMLVRIVPQQVGKQPLSGVIWFGTSDADGLRFEMDDRPLIRPGPAAIDRFGCEDPTVVPTADSCTVYYTGIDEKRDARLLYAEGPDIRRLKKRGVAHVAKGTERHTKEAAVECLGDADWRLFFEYSIAEHSRVGVARGPRWDGPWTEAADPFASRPEAWDSWHVSTGPILRESGPANQHLMFYNGADKAPHWNIGWVVIDDRSLTEIARCEGPLIDPPQGDKEGSQIAFAASLVKRDQRIWLYFTRDDRALFRATLVADGSREAAAWFGEAM